MSYTDSFSDGEFEAVIAAAAYAINSLEEQQSLRKQNGSVKFSEDSLPRPKSRSEDTKIKLTSFRGSFKRWLSDQEPKEDAKPGVSGDNFKRQSATAEQTNLEDSSANHRITEKAMDGTLSVKKTPTFTDKYLNETGGKRVESGTEMRPGPPRAPSTKKYPTSPYGNRTQQEYSPAQSKEEAEADAWEKPQLIKIRDRYDKMMTMIMEWENEKKAKAKRRLEQKENEPEERRARALQKYEDEISRIEKVAGEARALAEERRRNDETKTRAKAGKMRSTGKIPRTCGCC